MSLGIIKDYSGFKKNSIIKPGGNDILSRDVATFDFGAINQILTGLSALNMKGSKVWSEIHSLVVSGQIQISDFDSCGKLLGFYENWKRMSRFFSDVL